MKKAKSAPSPPAHARLEKTFICIACFLAGAAIMTVELAGSRLITPVFGNTLYTWTGLIGLLLLAIALGDWIGGWVVDRSPAFHTLGTVILAAALFTLLILPIFAWLRPFLATLDVVTGPLAASFLLFALPVCLLAAVSPFTVRLLSRALSDQQIGLSAGLIGMLGTLGSFVGTLGTGLWLIPHVGLRGIFIGCAVVLLVLGVLALWLFRSRPKPSSIAVAVLLFLGAGWLAATSAEVEPAGMVWKQSTFYHDIRVIDQPIAGRGLARLLQLDTTAEGAQIVATGELVFGYQRFWKLGYLLVPNLRSALFIGGGGFGMPQHLQRKAPDAKVTVVELDPAVIETGRRYFRLAEFPMITVEAMDARRFLDGTKQRFDLIFGDAYSGVHSVPAHLLSREFFQQVADRLEPDGVYMMNVISSPLGDRSQLRRAVTATLSSVFPHVAVFAVNNPQANSVQNLILVASQRDLSRAFQAMRPIADLETLSMLDRQVELPAAEHAGPVITDDRNPSELILARQLRLEKP